MRPLPRFSVFTLLIALGLTGVARADPDTTFTYQGQLNVMGQAYTGTSDYRFSLWDAATGGGQVGPTITSTSISVSAGLFTAPLDFGASPFTAPRWLEIAVRTPAWNGMGAEPAFTTLDQRQPLTRNPYSIQTRGIFVNEDGSRVGLGTTTPATRLHVIGEVAVGSDAAQTRLREVAPTDPQGWSAFASFPGIGIGSEQGANQQMVLFNDGFGNQPIFTVASSTDSGANWLPRLSVRQDGLVGIGTANPQVSLDISGGVRARGGPPGGFGNSNNGYAFSGVGDTDSGLFSLANGQVSIFTDNIERVRFGGGGITFPSNGTSISRNQIVASASGRVIDFGPIGAGVRASVTGSLTGVQVGDVVIVTVNGGTPFPLVHTESLVLGPDQFRAIFQNTGSSTFDAPPITFSVVAIRP